MRYYAGFEHTASILVSTQIRPKFDIEQRSCCF